MSEYLSNKFKWLSVLSALAVVIIHAKTLSWTNPDDWTGHVQFEIGYACSFAVPVFLVISGYLFASSYKKYGWGGLLRRKFWSLYVPCIIWMFLNELMTLPVGLYSHNHEVTIKSLMMIPLLQYEGLYRGYHFWYLRALLLLFLVAPLVFAATGRKLAYLLVAILTAMFFCCVPMPNVQFGGYCFQFYRIAIPFFLLGAGLGRCKCSLILNNRWLAGLVVLLSLSGVVAFWTHEEPNIVIRFLLACIVWFGYDIVMVGRKGRIPKFFEVTFVIYCMHMIVIAYINGLGKILLDDGSAAAKMTGFICNCVGGFTVCLVAANLMRKRFPRVHRCFSGQR